ncbi:class I SAM-dependent methyltransferase [Pelagicoccus sp. SDUM812002]|uniref:class I SAM-dependent methyltransferase n=1 Tax=Pelagicoccus sp. SDUM812002 TaxID=3041266 RepID=UPI00280C9A56|nr:class I SAM-dependent methyltransferase [Pelagicoccus sp. SDUM812002]MDQ8185920.1 class I SAM-dependent methyltransferase [Pelagicoccus sp. SDUM812002]
MNTLLEKLNSVCELLSPDKSFTLKESYIDCSTDLLSIHKHDISSESTSSHNYPSELEELIRERQDGWVLDCGSGSRERKFKNVINFEIHPYPGVDVVGIAEELPFKNQSFELVISLAVLEHVKNPEKAAREMQRVLKPGGLIWIDVAFMQPYHGYPAHFYNMTQQGLEQLLTKEMKIIRDEVPRYGTPIWSLSWIVSKYANCLPPSTRETFLSLPISELLKSPEVLCEESFATDLDEVSRKEMAATVSILARKEHN